jgi:hypothetical protein
MEQTSNNNVVKLCNSSDSGEFIAFYFEKSLLENHFNVSITLQLNNVTCNFEKWTVHINEIIKMASWYNNMPTGSADKYSDLIIEDLNLEFTNYFFEKGEGYYYLSYKSEVGKKFKFHFLEQLGNSNTIIFKNLMECLKNCT